MLLGFHFRAPLEAASWTPATRARACTASPLGVLAVALMPLGLVLAADF